MDKVESNVVRKGYIDVSKESKRAKLVRRYIYMNSTELSRIENTRNLSLTSCLLEQLRIVPGTYGSNHLCYCHDD
jgi:hypothetical protein